MVSMILLAKQKYIMFLMSGYLTMHLCSPSARLGKPGGCVIFMWCIAQNSVNLLPGREQVESRGGGTGGGGTPEDGGADRLEGVSTPQGQCRPRTPVYFT